jgi:2-oxoglutarate dehydrogenase complex dehydrogenase (E1) component-like enzyme
MIPMLDHLIRKRRRRQETVIGMVTAGGSTCWSILGKMPKDLFAEFEGKHASDRGRRHTRDFRPTS